MNEQEQNEQNEKPADTRLELHDAERNSGQHVPDERARELAADEDVTAAHSIDACPSCGAVVERIETTDRPPAIAQPCGHAVAVTVLPAIRHVQLRLVPGAVDRLGSRELLQRERELIESVAGGGDAADLGEPAGDELGTYKAMLDQYLRDQRHWIGPAQTPLVFHLRKIGAKLDANPDSPASLSSAYLQAFHRLDRQRPGNTQPAGAAGDLPGQGSIFDELED